MLPAAHAKIPQLVEENRQLRSQRLEGAGRRSASRERCAISGSLASRLIVAARTAGSVRPDLAKDRLVRDAVVAGQQQGLADDDGERVVALEGKDQAAARTGADTACGSGRSTGWLRRPDSAGRAGSEAIQRASLAVSARLPSSRPIGFRVAPIAGY